MEGKSHTMQKERSSVNKIVDLVRSKRAVRHFTPEPLPGEVVEAITEAGRLSGSAKNQQPWHFIFVQQHETLTQLAECGEYAGHLAGAALGVVLVTHDPFERITVPFDLGRATQNMMLTAWSYGVGSVMATIYQPEKARIMLGVPAAFTIPWCISMGYPAREPLPARKGGRRSVEDVIHSERW